MEKKTEVKVFEIRLYCPECGEEMTNDGEYLACNPPVYQHWCIHGHEARVRGFRYPKIEYKSIE